MESDGGSNDVESMGKNKFTSPSHCAAHSIIIINQSGSMRNSGVKEFQNRSKAAHGVLALEYIVEQLHQRRGHDGIGDAFSIIAEMNNIGKVVHSCEPLD